MNQQMNQTTEIMQAPKSRALADIFLPANKAEAYKLAESFCQSQFCPPAYRNKPADVYLAMAHGAQLGMNPLLAVQNIAVVNNKPSVYGDALTAIVMAHPETQEYDDGYLDDGTAYCKIVRRNRTIYRTFSIEQAKRAGLWDKGTWKQYPERMLLWRAKGWAIRDGFADVLMGLWTYEEAIDMSAQTPVAPINVTPVPAEPKAEQKPEAQSTTAAIKTKLKKAKAAEEDPSGKVSPIPEESTATASEPTQPETTGPETESPDAGEPPYELEG